MKKLFAIAVIFALAAGTVFAMDAGGTVFGHVNVLEGTSLKDDDVKASGGFDRLRIDGGGEAMEGKFGGYIRFHGDGGFSVNSAQAWWKPLDQLKFTIGQNINDGMWGKEGVTGWSFNQMPYDCGVALNSGIWYGDGWGSASIAPGGGSGLHHTRYAFFGGWDAGGAALEIKPIDILSINIGIPFFENQRADKVFSHLVAQVDVNVDGIGNIALTYKGEGRGFEKAKAGTLIGTGDGSWELKDADSTNPANPPHYDFTPGDPIVVGGKGFNEQLGTIFLYYGNSFGAIGIDFGVGFHLPKTLDPKYKDTDYKGKDLANAAAQPLGIGLGLKFAASDAFGIKFRTTVAIPLNKKDDAVINADLLPYFAVNENIAIFLNTALKVTILDEDDTSKLKDAKAKPYTYDPVVGFLVNPYLRVGAEWGPTFYVGIQLYSSGAKENDDYMKPDGSNRNGLTDKSIINFSVPISLMVSF